jgi:hypothetical protein
MSIKCNARLVAVSGVGIADRLSAAPSMEELPVRAGGRYRSAVVRAIYATRNSASDSWFGSAPMPGTFGGLTVPSAFSVSV